MIPELGHYALMLALGLALIQGTMPIVGNRTNDPVLMSMAAPTALAQFAFVAMAFAALAICYVIRKCRSFTGSRASGEITKAR
jgi:cytochrome c-type biogenesis protein CcmF